jgi:hypothetical protein
MDTNKKTLTVRIVTFALVLIAIVILMGIVVKATTTTTKYDSFAQCLSDKGLKFYGAFWCPHCQAQKREFGGSVKLLPYIECSTPDGKGQTQVCIDNKIESYPTWVYPDGTRTTGEQPLAALAEKSGCTLPAGLDTSAPATSGAASSAQ